MDDTRKFSPMRCQTPDRNNIFCTDCRFRDRDVVEVNGKTIPVGVTRDTCEIFTDMNFKPSEILFQGAPCEFYAPDEG